MVECSKIVKIIFGYILAIILLTVFVLSVRFYFNKNIRENYVKESCECESPIAI